MNSLSFAMSDCEDYLRTVPATATNRKNPFELEKLKEG